jgi:hypothetical protein
MVAKGALLRLLAHLLTEMITRGPSTSYLTYECRLRAISGWLRLRRSREVNYQKVGPACVHP